MLSSREKSIIIGTILGDSHVRMLKRQARLELGHSANQKDYLFWKYEALKRFVLSEPHYIEMYDNRHKKTYKQWRFRTKSDEIFTDLRNIFYRGGIKVIPTEIYSLMDSTLVLAVWFMDDGGRRNDCHGMFLNTLSFTKKEHKILQELLKKNFSIDTRVHWVQDGYRLYIPSAQAEHFCSLVYSHIIPSMRYKLSYNPVTTSFARLDRARDRNK